MSFGLRFFGKIIRPSFNGIQALVMANFNGFRAQVILVKYESRLIFIGPLVKVFPI